MSDMPWIRIIAAFAVVALVGCQKPDAEAPPEIAISVKPLTQQEDDELYAQADALFGALPDAMPGSQDDTPELAALGEKLYFDTRLSENNTQSCNTCHLIDNGRAGVDNEVTSKGARGARGERNSPTVLNAGFHFVQFWDGRAEDLIAQAKGPILNPVEMAMPSEAEVERKIGSIPEYAAAFSAAYPQEKRPVTYNNIATAIAAFERTLISRSRFDDYMGGDRTALTDVEKRGLQTFVSNGCITCHVDHTFGGQMYQKLGLVHPYQTKDAGRYAVTKDPDDSLMFKVPSLRNVALTAPYFHDGSIPKLETAVELMAWHQLGRKLDTNDVTVIVAFLHALSDPSRTGAPKPQMASAK